MSSSELWLAGFRKRLLESAQSLTCWLLLVSLLERRLMVALFRFPLAPPPNATVPGVHWGVGLLSVRCSTIGRVSVRAPSLVEAACTFMAPS